MKEEFYKLTPQKFISDVELAPNQEANLKGFLAHGIHSDVQT